MRLIKLLWGKLKNGACTKLLNLSYSMAPTAFIFGTWMITVGKFSLIRRAVIAGYLSKAIKKVRGI